MPRKLEAGGKYEYVLKSDRESVDPKPTFFLKILSARENDALQTLTEAYRSTTIQSERSEAIRGALAIAVLGWRDMGGNEFSIDELENLLTRRECWELVADVTLEASMTHDERKKLESPAKSETETSVAGVETNAKTG